MKVGLVTLYFPPLVRGGAHLSAYYIARGLAEAGHEVHVFTARPPAHPGQNPAQWHHPHLNRHEIFPSEKPATSWGMDYASLVMARRLGRYLRQKTLTLDILHAYGMDTIPAVVHNRRYGRAAATINGYWATCPFWDHTDPATQQVVKSCTYAHIRLCVNQRSQGQSPGRRLLKWAFLSLSQGLHRAYARRLDLILPISRHVRSILLANGFEAAKMHLCYNMIDPAEYENLDPKYLHRRFKLPAEKRILLHAGRFAPYKGTQYILAAAPQIIRAHPDVHFVFVGQGALLGSLEAQAQAAGLAAHVTFGQFIDPQAMPHAYRSAYALLHTATWPEPFARGPLEALAAGTPVIGTATGGTPEIIADGETGLLIPPFNPGAIAAACDRLLNDPAWRQRLAQTGRRLVYEKFSLSAQIQAYLRAYERVL